MQRVQAVEQEYLNSYWWIIIIEVIKVINWIPLKTQISTTPDMSWPLLSGYAS